MRTVLLADTDPDTRQILEDYLGANGFRVETCGTAATLMDRVRVEPPDAVILEPYVLSSEPVELVRTVRAGSSRPLPVLVYTSSPWRSVLREVEDLGASVLTKPARPGRVLMVLEALLRGGAPDLPPPPAPGGDAPFAGT